MSRTKKQKIVILGGGFGGVHTFLSLQKQLRGRTDVEITLISNTNYFLFTPFLHEVATAGMQAEDVIEPLSSLVSHPCAEAIEASVKNISVQKKIITTSLGEREFDFLVIALGSTTNFYGIPGAEEHCLTLKNVEDALKIKNNFISLAQQNEPINIAIIGGGATGVELAAETADLYSKTLKKNIGPSKKATRVEITVIEQAAELLPGFSPAIKQKTLRLLKKKGITVLCNTAVKEIDQKSIYTQNGKIAASLCIWTAGIKPSCVESDILSCDKKGCFLVDPTLQLCGTKNVFVIGDIALCMDQKTQKPIPHLAQTALQQAQLTAKNITLSLEQKSLQTFTYRPLGQFVSLGHNHAFGEISRFSFSGRPGSWLWHVIHLSKVLSWEKRINIALNWMFRLLRPRDISKF